MEYVSLCISPFFQIKFLDTERMHENGEYFEESVLYCLKASDDVPTAGNSFLDSAFSVQQTRSTHRSCSVNQPADDASHHR